MELRLEVEKEHWHGIVLEQTLEALHSAKCYHVQQLELILEVEREHWHGIVPNVIAYNAAISAQ